jgi:hypothetical protein
MGGKCIISKAPICDASMLESLTTEREPQQQLLNKSSSPFPSSQLYRSYRKKVNETKKYNQNPPLYKTTVPWEQLLQKGVTLALHLIIY